MEANHKHGLYYLNTLPVPPESRANASVNINVLHWQMGHISVDCLKQMVVDHKFKNINAITGTPKFCEACTLGKLITLQIQRAMSTPPT
jgi:hypothetical protein